MNQLITMVMVLFIGIIGIGLVLAIGNPVVKSAVASGAIDEAENILNMIDSAVMAVSEEGNGASRVVSFYSNNDGFESLPDEDAFQFDILGNFADYGSRQLSGNLGVFAGDECDCHTEGDMIMENDKIYAEFDSNGNMVLVRNKVVNITVPVTDGHVYLSGRELALSNARLVTKGKSLPLCKVVADANLPYKVVYTLYTGADFLVIDIIK